MKKKILAGMLVFAMVCSLGACSGEKSNPKDTKEGKEGVLEQEVVKWNYGTSGNVLVTIAEEKGYFEDEGIQIDPVEANANADAMTLLATGKVDVVSNAGTSNPLQQIASGVDISELSFYEEHSLTKGSSSKAVAYVGVNCKGKVYWGVGIDADIIKASIEALTVAVNKIEEIQHANDEKEERMIEILNYIQANYLRVTLDDLSEKFFFCAKALNTIFIL